MPPLNWVVNCLWQMSDTTSTRKTLETNRKHENLWFFLFFNFCVVSYCFSSYLQNQPTISTHNRPFHSVPPPNQEAPPRLAPRKSPEIPSFQVPSSEFLVCFPWITALRYETRGSMCLKKSAYSTLSNCHSTRNAGTSCFFLRTHFLGFQIRCWAVSAGYCRFNRFFFENSMWMIIFFDCQ